MCRPQRSVETDNPSTPRLVQVSQWVARIKQATKNGFSATICSVQAGGGECDAQRSGKYACGARASCDEPVAFISQ